MHAATYRTGWEHEQENSCYVWPTGADFAQKLHDVDGCRERAEEGRRASYCESVHRYRIQDLP